MLLNKINPIAFEEIKKQREEIINCTDNTIVYKFLKPYLSKKNPHMGNPTAFKTLKKKEVFHKKISEWPFNVPNLRIDESSIKPISIVKKKIKVNCKNGYDIINEVNGSGLTGLMRLKFFEALLFFLVNKYLI